MIDIAVIGAGRIGQIHAANLHQQTAANLRCIIDVFKRRGGTTRGIAARPKLAHWKTMLADRSIQAVVIASSTDTHADLVTTCANAGKAIFLREAIGPRC